MMRFWIALTLCLCFAVSKGDAEDGQVAKYTFNKGRVRDEVGNNHPHLSEVVLTEDRFGNSRSACLLFGNFTSYISLGSSPVLKPRHGTISIWFRIERDEPKGKGYQANPIILTKNLQPDGWWEGYCLDYNFHSKRISGGSAVDSTQQVSVHSNEKVKLQSWYHAVYAYNDDKVWFYLNGELQNGGPLHKGFASVFSPTDSVLIGCTANKKNERCFLGSIDDISIYNRVLEPEEVKALYEEPDYNRFNLYLKWFLWLVASVSVIVAIVMLRYRRELKRREEKSQVDARLNALETRAVRMQMNPHFIFNSLNTLQYFILEEDFQKSNLYLVKLSTLLRRLVESSLSDFIALSEETEILTSYLEVESLRFDNSFRSEIHNEVRQPEAVYIPFMLVQPFVENAIWHGLLPKKGDRFVSIHFSEPDSSRILCVIDDNGLGRRNTAGGANPFKRRSMGLEFIRQRLELLQKSTGLACGLEVIDKRDAEGNALGTTIKVLIPKLKP